MEEENNVSRLQIPGGYIIVARKILDSPVWHWSPDHQRLWLYLLLKARWDERPGVSKGARIQRGQLLKSYREIADECWWIENNAQKRWEPTQVMRMLDRMKEAGMISKELVTGEHGTGLGTLITIKNFNAYQDPERYKSGACDGACKSLEQACDIPPVTPSEAQEANNNRDSEDPGLELVTPLKAGACNGIGKERKNPTPRRVIEVFGYWETRRAEVIGKAVGPPMRLTKKRLTKIQARLAEGYTVVQLKEAVDGCLSSRRNLDRGYTDIELICRDQTKVEQYRAWNRNGPPEADADEDHGATERNDWDDLLRTTVADRD